jgi:hypothetical protein
MSEPPRQILAAIEADLDREGEPRLQAHVHQPELPIEVIEVVVQALAPRGDNLELLGLGILANREALAWLDAAQDANQSFGNLVALSYRLGNLFLGPRRGFEVEIRASRLFDHRLDVGLEGLGEPTDKRPEILIQDAVIAQESIKAIAIADGSECATEEDPVETRQDANKAALMPLQETLHVAPPEDWVEQYHHPECGVERHFETSPFGCGR